MGEFQVNAVTPQDVDLTRPLSEDMKQWLINRNHGHLVEENEAFLASKTKDQPAEASPAAKDQPAEASPAAGEDDGDDYDQWKLPELQEECGLRGLSKSGTKAELIARLRENDATESITE